MKGCHGTEQTGDKYSLIVLTIFWKLLKHLTSLQQELVVGRV